MRSYALKRELHVSSNDDRWFLARDEATGRPFVLHKPFEGSGGLPVELETGSFLVVDQGAPEHQELVRLIGTLVDAPVKPTFEDRPPEPGYWVPAGEAG